MYNGARSVCEYSLVVEYILAKDETGVRFSLLAQETSEIGKLCFSISEARSASSETTRTTGLAYSYK